MLHGGQQQGESESPRSGDPDEAGVTPVLTRVDAVERLRSAVIRPLTLVRAPSGYGKSEAVQQFCAHADLHAAWAPAPAPGSPRLDWFWHRFAHALGRAHPGVTDAGDPADPTRPGHGDDRSDLGGLSDLTPDDPDDVVVDTVLRAAANLPGTTAVILDELDPVVDAIVARQLTLLVERLPPNLRLVLVSRCDLPLPTGRWRAQGRMTEIGAADLRFTTHDTAALLGARGLTRLDPGAVRALTERAEGWPAGVQLLARALPPDRPGAPVTAGEVAALPLPEAAARTLTDRTLGAQEPEIQAFLLATSVLGRFSADLCRAVTEQPDAGHLLRRADEANLFVVPLDDDTTWFRYQGLFAELLRAELDRRHPGAARSLRRRAAGWYAARHDAHGAVLQLSAAGDLGEAFSMVSTDPYDAGWGHLIGTDWSRVFPAGWVAGDPIRMLHFGALLGRNGQLGEATRWLDRAAAELEGYPEGHPARGVLLSAQAMWHGVTMHARRCEELGLRALDLPVPPEAAVFHERVRVLLLGSRLLLDDFDGAEEMCRQLDVTGSSEIMRSLMAPAFRSHAALRKGELREAAELARRVLQTARAMGIPHHPGLRDAQVALAGVHAERGDFDEAERLLDLAATMADNLSWPAYAAVYRAELAQVRAGRDGPEAGLTLLDDVREQLAGEPIGPELWAVLDGHEAGLRLEAGETEAAAQLVGGLLPGMHRDLVELGLAMADADLDTAAARLDAFTPTSRRTRLARDLAAGLVAMAAGEPAERDRHLLAAARAAHEEGFATIFVRAGGPLLPALRSLADRHPELSTLIGAVDVVAARRTWSRRTELSAREVAVLRHLTGAMTHLEIAGELGVSTNTVKSHVRSLYRKLGVQSRPDAVAAARRAALL